MDVARDLPVQRLCDVLHDPVHHPRRTGRLPAAAVREYRHPIALVGLLLGMLDQRAWIRRELRQQLGGQRRRRWRQDQQRLKRQRQWRDKPCGDAIAP